MEKLKIKMKNCFGIKEFEKELDFSKFSVNLIYASNGLMKTSFQKGFYNYSKTSSVKDEISGNKGKIEIIDENGNHYAPSNILSFRSLDTGFISSNLESLLVDGELKKDYIKLTKEIDIGLKGLIEELRKKSGLTGNVVEQTLKTDLDCLNKSFIEFLIDEYEKIKTHKVFIDINYNDLFQDKEVFSLIKEPKNIELLEKYEAKRNSILKRYDFYRKGGFEPAKAQRLVNALEENMFLDVVNEKGEKQNAIVLAKEPYEDIDKLKKAITDSTISLDEDKELKEIAKMLSKGVKAKDKFAKLLNDKGADFIVQLKDVKQLKKDIWLSYLYDLKDNIKGLIELYKRNIDEINEIINKAEIQKTKWYEVVDEFTKRFSTPFTVEVSKEKNTIIGIEKQPTLEFLYDNGRIKFNHRDLVNKDVLSGGELRALYILNILFEIKAAEKSNKEYILVFDDIADSFDYQNKYAILYYLKELSENKNFKLIILTHNFDFFRNLQIKVLGKNRKNSYLAFGNNGNIDIDTIEKMGIIDPFKEWKQKFHKQCEGAKLIALIPFMREICRYNGNNQKTELTALLHVKKIPDSYSITLRKLESIIHDIFSNDADVLNKKLDLYIGDEADTVYDFLENTVIPGIVSKQENWGLEDKVAISIFLRIKAEKFIISFLSSLGVFVDKRGVQYNNYNDFLSDITENQTNVLIENYLFLNPGCSCIDILKDINLITSENIHINSFMYEPILDTSEDELKRLYHEVISYF